MNQTRFCLVYKFKLLFAYNVPINQYRIFGRNKNSKNSVLI